MKLSKSPLFALCMLASMLLVGRGGAATVEPGVGYTNSFDTQPSAADWATARRAGGASDSYDMDADVNTNMTATLVSQLTYVVSNSPPSAYTNASWNSAGGYLATRPSGGRYTALMGKFVNNTGSNATEIALSYQLTLAGNGSAEESGRGTRVYYSFTGLLNSWTNLPTLNNMATADGSYLMSTNLLLEWPIGAKLYLLWTDDNSSGSTVDSANEIDNFSIQVMGGYPSGYVCKLDSPGRNSYYLPGNPITATATVVDGTPPFRVEYFTNSGAGNTVFSSAGSSVTAPYSVSLAALPVGSYNVYAVATDSSVGSIKATSLTNAFAVLNPITATLTAPADGATYDYTTPITAAATVTGGTQPYSVQFYLDGVAHGSPATTAPYTHDLGNQPIGDHTIYAKVVDGRGWTSNTVAHLVHVGGPMSATLTPTNGTVYNYGQSVTLTGAVIGGTAPYAVSFYDNDVLVAQMSSAPYVTNLGVLAVGSHTCYVHSVDSGVPTPTQTNSGVNVITILANPLVANLTGPTAGQSIPVGQAFTVTATATVKTPVSVTGVEFFLDGISVGTDTTTPYASLPLTPALGSHTVYAVATDSLGRQTPTVTNQVTVVLSGCIVGPQGYTNDFSTQPVAADWATFSRSGGGSDSYTMSIDVNSNITASSITSQAAADTANPPAANASAVWSSTGGYLQTRPTGNRYTVLMAKFVNDSGTNATQVGISYRFTIAAASSSEDTGLGTQVFYSLSGETNSWISLGTFNTTASTNGSAVLSTNLAINWPNGASLYLLWADDNAGAGGMGATDPANQIDNFSLRVKAGAPLHFACAVLEPVNQAVYLAGTTLKASALIGAGTGPYTVEYFTNSGAGNTVFRSAGSLTAEPYNLNLGVLPAATYNIYAVATDSSGVPQVTTSATNTFVIANPISFALATPADGATFDKAVSVEASSTVSGGTPPFSVQFYVDGTPSGAPVTAAPYARDLGLLFVGDHTVSATVTDWAGWQSNSAVHTIHITGSVAVMLSPTNGTSYNYGQTLELSAVVGGGTPPYTLTFYTNNQPVAVVGQAPFAITVGMVPVGSYTCSVQAVDSTVPVAGTVDSGLNVITILPNPLSVTLTNPKSGQNVANTAGFTAVAVPLVASPVTISAVEFFVDDASVGVATAAPYTFKVGSISLGSHTVYAAATDSLGRQSYTATNQINSVVDPLANDNFANRIALAGPSVSITGANSGATTETGEPTGSGWSTYGATLWWSWTAPANGTAVINTTGSSFNTSLGVYTGSAVNTLSQVGFSGSIFGQTLTQVSFTAVKGTEYQIQVGGMSRFGPGGGGAASGSIQLNLQMPASVAITSPTNGTVLIAGTSYEIAAAASTPNGSVTKVDFYIGGVLVGTDTSEPYSHVVSSAVAGTNSLVAVVTDSAGVTATSATVNVAVFNWGLTLISPVDGTVFTSATSITASAYAMLASGTMTNVDFYVDGVYFGQASTAPFSAVWSNVAGGSHRLTAVGKDDSGKTYNSQPAYIGVAQTFLARGWVWKYLDNGSDQGTAWRNPGFDDSTWASGPAELGYGDDDEATKVNSGPSDSYYITTYFRSTFVASNLSKISSILMNVKRDDGAIVYLNGVEAARFNMSTGAVDYLTTASNADDDGANFYAATVSRTSLVEGTNVIAVEIHQSSSTSTDISFNMDLSGIPYIIRNQYPVVTLTSPADKSLFYAPATFTLEAQASDSDGSVTKVEFYDNDTKLAELTSPPYALVLTNVPASAHLFTAVATDDQGAKQSSSSAKVNVYNPASLWVAYNDHYAGPGTHANATAWNAFGTEGGAPGDSGPLRNIATGTPLSATLTILELGAQGDTVCGAPLTGTPAYSLFNGYVDFGTGDKNHAILVNGDSMVVHLFTGLDPSRRYNVRATVVGGTASYTNRWTLFGLTGADDYVPAHTANVLTAANHPESIAADEAAMNTGDNQAGDVVGWNDVAPGSDGAFMIVSSQYLGAAPGNAAPGSAAYAPVAVRLEEVGPLPFVRIAVPADGAEVTGPTNVNVTAEAEAVAGISNVLFFANGTPIGSATTYPYTVVWERPDFGTYVLTATAYDNDGLAGYSLPSTMHLVTPPTNTIAPTVYITIPAEGATISNLTSVQVIFSQWVAGVDAQDLLVNGVPATNVVGSGTNYLFTFAQPAYGTVSITWASNSAIHDFSWPENLPFYDNNPDNYWTYNLIDLTAPAITARSPAAGSTATNLTQVNVTFSEPVAGIKASDLLVNGVPAYEVQGAGASYAFSVSQPSSGTVSVTWASNQNIVDLAPAKNAFNGSAAGASWSFTLDAKTILIQSNSFWLFVKGTNEASTPSSAWRLLSFNDSGWSNAPAPFFYGDPYSNGVPAYTLLSDMRSNYSTIYLRKSFSVANASGVTNLFLRAQIDDGMIVWINGVEALRTNAPSGEVPYNGIASGTPTEPQNAGVAYVTYTLANPRNYLVSGTNVIAVQALNESLTTSSDFAFNAQLYTYQTDTEAVAPHLTDKTPAAGYVYGMTNITVTFSEPVTGVNAGDLLVNGAPATGLASATNTVYTFSFPQPAYGQVSISWAADNGITDLDIVPKPFSSALPSSTWGYVLLNPDAPHLVAKTPAAQATVYALTQLSVTFNEAVTGVNASDLLVNGVPATGLTGSGSIYTFTFPQPGYGIVYITWATNHGIQDLKAPPIPFDPSWPDHTWVYALVDKTPPTVAAVQPPAGSNVTNLTQLTVTFSEKVSGVNASDLLVNGKAASSISGSNTTYTFTFGQPNASLIQITWALSHGITDTATNAFDATGVGATWSYATLDNLPPSLISLVPAPSSTVRSLRRVAITFDEAVQGLSAGSLTINGEAASSLSGSGAGPYTFGFDQPPTGQVQLALSSAIRDLAAAPNAYAGSNWVYDLNTNLPPPTVTRGPYLAVRTTNSMVIRWRTSTASDSSVQYGADEASRTNTVYDLASTTEHMVKLTNLKPNTRYVYAIGTSDGSMNTSENYWFKTAPMGGQGPTRVWFISDYGFKDEAEASVRDLYFNSVAPDGPADVWLTGGDNDQTSGTDAYLTTAVFGSTYGYSNLLVNVPLTPTFGNHDYQTASGAAYFASFTMPTNGEAGGVASGTQNYYSHDYNNIHFVSLDAITAAASASSNSAMAQWLHRDLSSTTQQWIIAYWHGPPYTKGSHDSDSDSDTLSYMVKMRENIVPILESYGVDLVLNGHSHVYERTWLIQGHYGYSTSFSETNKVDGGDGRLGGTGAYLKTQRGKGTVYVTAAVGGQLQNRMSEQHPAHLLKIADSLGCLVIDVNSNRLDFQFMGVSGATLDYFSINKGVQAAPPATPTGLAASQVAVGQVQLTWSNAPRNEMGYALERSTDGSPFMPIATIGANLMTYTDTGLGSAGSAIYRIRAWNQAGYSAYSELAIVGGLSLSITQNGTTATVSWPAAVEGYDLQFKQSLSVGTPWQTITEGIVTVNSTKQYQFVPKAGAPVGFFRLYKP